MDLLLSQLFLLCVVFEHVNSFLVNVIRLLLDLLLDFRGRIHPSSSLFFALSGLLLLDFFEFFRCHCHPALPFFLLFLLLSIRVLACVLHRRQDLWSQEHVLDFVLPAVLLIVIDAIVVLDSLRVEEHELIDGFQSELS